MQAVVTGGAGFIGSHLVDALVGDGHRVTVIDDLSSGEGRRIHREAQLCELDIVDRARLEDAIERAAPEAIYHLAAQASVTASVKDPARDCAVNVQGTLNVVDVASRLGVPVVFTSTGGALYGDDAPLPTAEDFIPAPLSPYGASKWAAESYVGTWARASGVPHAICRLGNVYGPRQNPHGEAGVVAILSLHLHAGTTPTLYGHGTPTRDYIHVDDVVRALLVAHGRAGTFNIATGVESDVSIVWEHLREVADSQIEPQLADLRAGELERSRLDVSHAARELGWTAQVPLREGLRQTYRALVAEFERAASAAR
ncbi:MAG: NAD-dependent epimerase/dehydratase family protein [Solirubrobacterales bacterium]|nr:NAD-dependent epimerase/dehydratase family protein [Solirubrobacterales bacterium]